jgi:hypothetical protein
MNRPLVFAGAVLAVLGVALFVYAMTAATGNPPPTEYLPQGRGGPESGEPPLAISIIAGLIAAAGAAMIGIGMNRWSRSAVTKRT